MSEVFPPRSVAVKHCKYVYSSATFKPGKKVKIQILNTDVYYYSLIHDPLYRTPE